MRMALDLAAGIGFVKPHQKLFQVSQVFAIQISHAFPWIGAPSLRPSPSTRFYLLGKRFARFVGISAPVVLIALLQVPDQFADLKSKDQEQDQRRRGKGDLTDGAS